MSEEEKKEQEQEQPIRRVIIGTPTIDGKVEASYVMSLIETFQAINNTNIQIFPLFIAYDTLIQRARNDLIQLAIDTNVDDLIFIDSDIVWKATDILKLLQHNVDLVGGTYRRKSDIESYVVRSKDTNLILNEENNLIEVDSLGCGILRMSKKCFRLLWEKSEVYQDNNGKRNKMVFDLSIVDGVFTSEDVSMCFKWRDLDEKVWLDPTITCTHIGVKKFEGDFQQWLENFNKTEQQIQYKGDEVL